MCFNIQENLQSVKKHNGTVNAILTLIREKSDISYDELAQKLNLFRRTVSRKIAQLKKNGQIRRMGADKNGYWEVMSNEQ